MSTYTFRYFNTIGFGETSRLLLSAAKVEWVEEHPEWPQEKSKQPFGQLPVLVEHGADGGPDLVLSESGTIERYLALTYGFLPADPSQAALQEQLRDRQMDILLLFRKYMSVEDGAKEGVYATFEELIGKLVGIQTELLRKNGNTGRSFGTALSYADIATYTFMKLFLIQFVQYSEVVPKLFKAKITPELAKLAVTVETDPLLAAYVSSKDRIATLVQV
ncbi:hypothetical protein GGF44_003728 [Coemansia sp. RSA 1694]|nr:hypothetical protein GGF38_004905 [Coemansia sp. RSA 25]KAJ2501932.1 hypothetical protein IWW47_003055 [Coemansia sp. RSA 2052]KAJ2583474.1 hypothetical protein GGH95_000976 [Coemansia sp. RSA 1836]KAJ2633153.1 hypothetical protein GGF44_003728 [Coemansia sp. RSA 1694]